MKPVTMQTRVRSLRYEDFLVAEKNLALPMVQLPLEVLPQALREERIVLHALLGFYTPSHNIKYIPASYMLERECERRGPTDGAWTFVENSSGNFALSLAACARARGFAVKAIVADDLTDGKLQPLLASGVDVIPESKARRMLGTTTGSGSDLAKRMAERKDWINLGQYSSASNPESYEKLLAPAAIGALNGCIQVFAAGLGSAGTFVGLGGAIKRSVPDVTMVAVIPHGGEDIPGCRDERRLKDVTHDWRSCADHVGYVTGGSAYRASLAMWRAGIPAGPSAGAALVGLCDYLAKARAERRLTGLRGPDGTVQCLFPCADLLSPYWDELQRHASDVGDRVKIA